MTQFFNSNDPGATFFFGSAYVSGSVASLSGSANPLAMGGLGGIKHRATGIYDLYFPKRFGKVLFVGAQFENTAGDVTTGARIASPLQTGNTASPFYTNAANVTTASIGLRGVDGNLADPPHAGLIHLFIVAK